jgi:hypothetical protein
MVPVTEVSYSRRKIGIRQVKRLSAAGGTDSKHANLRKILLPDKKTICQL